MLCRQSNVFRSSWNKIVVVFYRILKKNRIQISLLPCCIQETVSIDLHDTLCVKGDGFRIVRFERDFPKSGKSGRPAPSIWRFFVLGGKSRAYQ